jgi:hypothetical protein
MFSVISVQILFLQQQQQLLVTICQTKYFFPFLQVWTWTRHLLIFSSCSSFCCACLLCSMHTSDLARHGGLRYGDRSRAPPLSSSRASRVFARQSRALPPSPLFLYRELYISLVFGVHPSALPCLKSLLKHIKL